MERELRPGETVVVRSAAEVLATLDSEGTTEGMPFMPEMLPFLGRRFVVSKRAQKVCDTIKYTGSRRLPNTVLLEDLRCDGASHDGCQAECRFYWKEAWLRRPAPGESSEPSPGTAEEIRALEARLAPHTRRVREVEGTSENVYRCQATDLLLCTTRHRLWQPRQYTRELTCGNVGLGRFLRVLPRALVWETMRKLGLLPTVHLVGTQTGPGDDEPLDLQPGEWVEVKQREDLVKNLSPRGTNRGLWFDWEMERYCGGRYRVRQRITRFIDDRNCRMVVLKTDAVTLESVTCTGNYSARRWFCPRAVYPFWRDSWLRRADGPPPERGNEARRSADG